MSSTTHKRVISRDEELGKRDDDFRPRPMAAPALNVAHSWRWRKRWRILALAAIVSVVYLLARNLSTDGEPFNVAFAPLQPGHIAHSASELKEPAGPPPRDQTVAGDERPAHNYDGKVRFFRLAASLHSIGRTAGRRQFNKNVLFASSSLKSLANILPLACEMGMWDRNYVHLAVLGRDPMPMEEILSVNGINATECKLYLHDARSDYPEYSTDRRAGVAVTGALNHINDFMHPQVIIIDDETLENDFFVRAMREQAAETRRPLIEIPAGKYEDLLWMAKLDSGSLASWYRPNIDILIRAPPHSSGGLLRAVRSLQDADYAGLKPPRLTIELPPDVDPFAARYLQEMTWPPSKSLTPLQSDTLALRHRIPSSLLKPEEASLRFLESFYPTSTDHNHVLLLSSQVEVDPTFFQYLHYTLLEYKYSAWGGVDAEDLLGISLDLPNLLINGKTGLDAPKVEHMTTDRYTEDGTLDKSAAVPFLYGAPSSTASLVFGDKWTIFHSFLKRRIAANYAGVARKSEKLITEAEPSWMEYLLELMRAKGWFMLHPASPLVTVHNDLARIPEEFKRAKKTDPKKPADEVATADDPNEDLDKEPFLVAAEPPPLPQRPETKQNHPYSPLHETLPFDGDLPELAVLPYVDHTGAKADVDAPKLARMQYASQFRKDIGGCSAADVDRPRVVPFLSADELFCLPDMDLNFGDAGDTEEEEIEEAILDDDDPPSAEPDNEDKTSSKAEPAQPAQPAQPAPPVQPAQPAPPAPPAPEAKEDPKS